MTLTEDEKKEYYDFADSRVLDGTAQRLSDEVERDSRRFDREFSEEREARLK